MTWIEWAVQAEILGCLGGRLWAQQAARRRKSTVPATVMYWNRVRWFGAGQTPRGSPGCLCRRRDCWAMHSAAATGQRSVLVASQKKGIFSLFCLFFCVLQQMRMEEILNEVKSVMMVMGISPLRKNSKLSAMKASGGCEGQAVMRL